MEGDHQTLLPSLCFSRCRRREKGLGFAPSPEKPAGQRAGQARAPEFPSSRETEAGRAKAGEAEAGETGSEDFKFESC